MTCTQQCWGNLQLLQALGSGKTEAESLLLPKVNEHWPDYLGCPSPEQLFTACPCPWSTHGVTQAHHRAQNTTWHNTSKLRFPCSSPGTAGGCQVMHPRKSEALASRGWHWGGAQQPKGMKGNLHLSPLSCLYLRWHVQGGERDPTMLGQCWVWGRQWKEGCDRIFCHSGDPPDTEGCNTHWNAVPQPSNQIPPSDNLEHLWPTPIYHLLNSVWMWKEKGNPEPTNETVVSILLGFMAFIESTDKSVDLQGFWKALCPLAEIWLPSLELRAGVWISGNCFSVPKTGMGQGPRIKRCEEIFAAHECFQKTAGNLESWDSGSAPSLSCSPQLLSHLWPFWAGVEWVLGGCRNWTACCLITLCYYFLHSMREPVFFRSQAAPSSLGLLYKSSHWKSFQTWRCKGMSYSQMGFKQLWDRNDWCCRSHSPLQQVPVLLLSGSGCHQGALSPLVCD